MRLLIGFLTLVLMVTACAAPGQPTSAPQGTEAPKAPAVVLDGTLKSSLLATVMKTSPRDNVLLPIDPVSGAALPGYEPISLGQTYFYALSRDRQILAVISYPGDVTERGSLLLIDLPAWKVRRSELKLGGWVNAMAFSPDGKRLAVAHGESTYGLTMVDTQAGTIMVQAPTTYTVTHLKFTKSGEALMLYGPSIASGLEPDPPVVRLVKAADLSTRWSAELQDVRDGMFPKDETITQLEMYQPGNSIYFNPGLDFAPDRDALYIVHSDSERLTTVDFDAQKVKTTDIQPKLSLSQRLLSLTAGVAHAKGEDGTSKQAVVSPDGQVLYVIGVRSTSLIQKGNLQTERTPLGLEIIRTSDGSRAAQIETDASELSLAPDGQLLYLRNWGSSVPWTEIFDTSNRRIIAHKEALYGVPTLLINGDFLLVSAYSTSEISYPISVLEPDGSRLLGEWTSKQYVDVVR